MNDVIIKLFSYSLDSVSEYCDGCRPDLWSCCRAEILQMLWWAWISFYKLVIFHLVTCPKFNREVYVQRALSFQVEFQTAAGSRNFSYLELLSQAHIVYCWLPSYDELFSCSYWCHSVTTLSLTVFLCPDSLFSSGHCLGSSKGSSVPLFHPLFNYGSSDQLHTI